ncbi:MAG: hypothetical protein MI725_00630, partial [Pirellulales bacterium]|nr:hypothetical protein [Pirellulales bacterium]
MVEVAVYNEQQHEQFSCATSRFVLRKSLASPARWILDDDLSQAEPPRASDAEVINFCLTHAGVVVNGGKVLPLPCVLQIGSTWVEVAQPTEREALAPLKHLDLVKILQQSAKTSYAGPSSATVSRWLNQAGEMHRAAAGSPQFYSDAARMAVEAVGLDAAWVLKHDEDLSEHGWQIVGSCLSNPQKGVGFDRDVLKYLQSQRVAWYQPTSPTGPSAQAVVIAPVLNEQKQLTGAIYG